MADHNKPVLGDAYADLISFLKARIVDVSLLFDSVLTSPTNLPENTKRWNVSLKRFQKWVSGSWVDLTDKYGIDISGDAQTLDGNYPTDFLGVAAQAADSAKLGGQLPAFYGSGLYIGSRVFYTGGTYIPTAGTHKIIVEIVAGGGAGGNVHDVNAPAAAGGGGGGGYLRKEISGIDPATTTGTMTIGAGGVHASSNYPNGNGGNGGNSSLAILSNTYLAYGGGGGNGGEEVASSGGSPGGTDASGDNNIAGESGGLGLVITSGGAAWPVSGKGGSSPYGFGGASVFNAGDGNPGHEIGSGGSGAAGGNDTKYGGNGGGGMIIIHEFK